MSRKTARESVFKLIFEFLFSGELNDRTFEILTATEENADDRDYIREAYTGVIDNYDDLVSMISEFSESFQVERIFKPDFAALLLATYEMKYMKDIPLSVSISEAVELVKKFSTEKSNQYVNGILSSVYKLLTAEGDQK